MGDKTMTILKLKFDTGYAFINSKPSASTRYLDQTEYTWSAYNNDDDLIETDGPYDDATECKAALRYFILTILRGKNVVPTRP